MTSLFRFVKWWIALGWVSLVLYQTIFILAFVIFYRLGRIASPTFFGNAIGLAGLWTFVEWLRAWGPFGVTGGDLGYSQAPLLPLIQIASFVSVYGISFMIALLNASLAQFLQDFKKWQILALSLLLIAVASGYGMQIMKISSGVPRPASRSVKLTLIQPNIDQKNKLDSAMVLPTFELQKGMTRQAISEKPDIIIWPETAVFTYLLHDRLLLPRIKKLAREAKAWLIVGTPHYVKRKAYNSVVSISPSGEIVSRYDKQQLVPFGEYLPFRKMLFPLLQGVGYYDNWYASNPHPKLISAGELKIATAICFESTFPDLVRRRVKKNSNFILTLTNDAWFGDSSAAYFHLNTGIFRAVENRKYFVQVGNTGFTAVIDPCGRILKRIKLNQRGILTFNIPLS